MPTLAELEAAARKAQALHRAERDKLADAERLAQEAIQHHADVHARVVGGAGASSDVAAAAAQRDRAIADLEALRARLL